MKTRYLIPLFSLSILPLAGCNLFGGLSSPSSDPQYLVAARACLDRGDYQCALDNYRALSGNQNDIKVSETSLTQLAQANIFSFSDLISSLGGATGSGGSFATMANDLARRGAASETNRLLIQTIYAANASINDQKLQAFSKFLAAISMVNELLAEIAGPDNSLTGHDIVANPSACLAANCGSTPTACDPVGGTSGTPKVYTNGSNSLGDPTNLDSVTNWNNSPTIQMLLIATDVANQRASEFRGAGGSGIFSAISNLGPLGSSAPGQCLIRQQVLSVFGLN